MAKKKKSSKMKVVEHEFTGKFVLMRQPPWTNLIDGVTHPAKIREVFVYKVVENNYFEQHPIGELMIRVCDKVEVYYPLSYVICESEG